MTTITHRSRLAAFVYTTAIALIATIAISRPAPAQACCETYTVRVDNSTAAACYPLIVTTVWSNGLTGTTTHTGPGSIDLPAPKPPGCWPGWMSLAWVTINGVNVFPPFGGSVVLNGNCRVKVGILSDAWAGCLLTLTIS